MFKPDGPKPERYSAGHVSKGRRGKFRVLVVEDETEAADTLAHYLKEEGYQVTTAYNGDQGLEKFHACGADIVITDIRMPKMDGVELIASLRQQRPDLPIIAVTGHMGATENLGPIAGDFRVEVLKKPISLSELLQKMAAICV